MFSALKSKLTSGSPSPNAGDKSATQEAANHGINSMNLALQRKFARGCNYNMKLLLRGDRNTGKSCLFKRLQGGSFIEQYTPSDEISVASIQWNYKATDDIVKVEVWDVVDRGKKRKHLEGLKLADGEMANFEPALDAEFVDVYKGAHGVILMFDVTKAWTFDYVKREAAKVPKHIPILILANFIDMAHHRCVTRGQAMGFIEDELDRGQDAAEARYAESSMRNGFGLKFLHRFLNLPFLTLQRESLMKQLETNKREMEATLQELDVYLESEDASYDNYASGVTKKRRSQAESLAPRPTVDVVVGQPSNTLKDPRFLEPAKKASPELPIEEKKVSPLPAAATIINQSPKRPSPKKSLPIDGKVDVDDFMPDSDAIDNFLEEDGSPRLAKLNIKEEESEDEESSANNNPMVASFEEDIVIEEYSASVLDHPESSDEDDAPKEEPTLKPKVKARLSNSSNKSIGHDESLHFDLPEHLVAATVHASIEETTLDTGESRDKKKHKKHKKEKKSKKQKSEDQERDELEEFLNGAPPTSIKPDEGSYEEL